MLGGYQGRFLTFHRAPAGNASRPPARRPALPLNPNMNCKLSWCFPFKKNQDPNVITTKKGRFVCKQAGFSRTFLRLKLEGRGPFKNKSPPFQLKPTWPGLKTRCERFNWKEAEQRRRRGKGLMPETFWGLKRTKSRLTTFGNFCLLLINQ